MNINKVYLCNVYQVVEWKIFNRTCLIKFVKKALVYKREEWYLNSYIDLNTRAKYYNTPCDLDCGDLFIKEKELIPISILIDCNRKYISKRKILKKYNEIKDGDTRYEH